MPVDRCSFILFIREYFKKNATEHRPQNTQISHPDGQLPHFLQQTHAISPQNMLVAFNVESHLHFEEN